MRYITPNANISNTLDTKETPNNSEEARNRWKNFSKHKPELLQNLLSNQYQLCCYSELRADRVGFSYHIEHIENKSQNPARTFDYTNLAASALNSDPDLRGFKGEPFGGHALGKQQSVDMTQFISCYQPDCQRFFSYLSNGQVIAAENLSPQETNQANYTIDILNLNSGYLKNLRKQWWEELDVIFEEHLLNGSNLNSLVGIYLFPTNQKLNHFFSLTYGFFNPTSKHILSFTHEST